MGKIFNYRAELGLCALLVILLTACTDTIQTSSPTDWKPIVYEIEHIDGHQAQMFVIEDKMPEDDHDKFERDRLDRERKDYLAVQRQVARNDGSFAEQEEERIEEYCKEYGFEACMEIDRTCEDEGCHKVTVSCDDDQYDDDEPNSCRRFDVDVREYINKDLTAESKEEIIEDGKCEYC